MKMHTVLFSNAISSGHCMVDEIFLEGVKVLLQNQGYTDIKVL